MALRLRRGTDAERLLVTPLQGELVYATDTKKLYVGDGATVGGVLVGPADADQFTELVADTSPQLGGDLDLNGNNITGNGNIDINGTITATGNIGLGDDTADIINVGGVINSPLRPAIDGNYDLGSAIRRWNRLYAEGAVLSGQLDAEAIATGKILSNSSTVVYDEITDTLAAANINGTTVDATTVNATTINAGEVVANFRGSIFSDDSTPVFDGINKAINVKSGTLDGVTIGGDGVTPARNITGREITANNGFFGNLDGDVTGNVTGNVSGNVTGDVLANDLTVMVDNSTKTFNTRKIMSDAPFDNDLLGAVEFGEDAAGDPSSIRVFCHDGDGLQLNGQLSSQGEAPNIRVFTSRGTADSKLSLQAGDQIAGVVSMAYNGSDYESIGAMATFVSGINGTSGELEGGAGFVIPKPETGGTQFWEFAAVADGSFTAPGSLVSPEVKTNALYTQDGNTQITDSSGRIVNLAFTGETGNTPTDGNNVDSWLEVSVNGNTRYIPLYA